MADNETCTGGDRFDVGYRMDENSEVAFTEAHEHVHRPRPELGGSRNKASTPTHSAQPRFPVAKSSPGRSTRIRNEIARSQPGGHVGSRLLADLFWSLPLLWALAFGLVLTVRGRFDSHPRSLQTLDWMTQSEKLAEVSQ